MFDWRRLTIFLKVYEKKNFSKAAKELYLSQPTVTVHIRELEEYLGVQLFERNTRHVIPTKAGHVFYKYGAKLWQIWSALEKELMVFKDEESGLVEIGASTIPGQYILPEVIKSFKDLNPKVKIFLRITDTQDVINKVFQGEYELGVVGAKPDDKRLTIIPCCEDEIVLIAPPNFPEDEVTIEKLPQLPLIAREQGSGTWKIALEHLGRMGLHLPQLNIVAEMSSSSGLKSVIKVGLGLGFISRRAVTLETALGLLKVVKIKDLSIHRKFYIIYLRAKRFTPACERFLNFLVEALS